MPNAFGLYDMHGNVWEWLSDCWNDSYQGSPTNNQAWTTGQCSHAVQRGGAWRSKATFLTSHYRFGSKRQVRYVAYGFRLAHDM